MSNRTPLTDPILTTPWDEPTEHWVLDPHTNQATNDPGDGRRPSAGRTLMPHPRKTPVQPELSDVATEPFDTINQLRKCVEAWRSRRYPGATARTRQLLEF